MKTERLLAYYRTGANAALACGVSPATISRWKVDRVVPEKWAAWIEINTGGALRMERELYEAIPDPIEVELQQAGRQR